MRPRRRTVPTAVKRVPPAVATPLSLPARALDSVRAMFGAESETTPAAEWAVSRLGTGLEAPTPESPSHANHLDRSFLFIDITGFTAYVDRFGEHAALDLLTHFRNLIREITARRGVRVGKWLGDGVMLVGVEPGVVVASAAEVLCRLDGSGLDVHAGLASGPVLLFEGDDYIGRSVNLAARLCDAATSGEILALVDAEDLPEWVVDTGLVTVEVNGVGAIDGVRQLAVHPQLLERFRDSSAA